MSETATGIYEALPRIIGEMPVIGKEKKNLAQHYSFRGVDDIYSALNLLLAKHKVCILPRVLSSESQEHESKSGGKMFRVRAKVEFALYASDGSFVTATTEGEAMDSGDKATPKALSMAYKYMAFQVFCIPSGEKIDTEEESPEVAPAPGVQRFSRDHFSPRPAAPGGNAGPLEPPPPGDQDAPSGPEAEGLPPPRGPVQSGLFNQVFEDFKKRVLSSPKGEMGFEERMRIARDVQNAIRNGLLSQDEVADLRRARDARS